MQKLSQSSFPKGFWGLFSGVCSAVTTDGFGSDKEELLDSVGSFGDRVVFDAVSCSAAFFCRYFDVVIDNPSFSDGGCSCKHLCGIVQLLRSPVCQNGLILPSHCLGTLQIVSQIVAAFLPLAAGDLAGEVQYIL